jgi:hypothetical protein
MKLIETLLGIGKQELLQFYGLGDDAIPPKRDGRSYLELPTAGLSFVLSNDDQVMAVHLYSEGRHGYSQYIGSMPFGLSFTMGRDAVRLLLGMPQRTMDATEAPLLGKMMARDIYTRGQYSVCVEYAPTMNELSLITISQK